MELRTHITESSGLSLCMQVLYTCCTLLFSSVDSSCKIPETPKSKCTASTHAHSALAINRNTGHPANHAHTATPHTNLATISGAQQTGASSTAVLAERIIAVWLFECGSGRPETSIREDLGAVARQAAPATFLSTVTAAIVVIGLSAVSASMTAIDLSAVQYTLESSRS